MELMFKTGEIIKEILQDRKNYFELVTKTEKQENWEPKVKGQIIQLIGSFLRNFYFIKHIEKFVFDTKDINVVIQVGLYFVNNAYANVISKAEADAHLNEYLKSIKKDISENQRRVLNDICNQKKQYMFLDLKRGSTAYFSVKYNLPSWFILMMIKHYGKDVGIKTCREISRMPKQYAILNSFKLSNGDVKTLIDKEFTLVKDNLYLYNNKVSLRKNPLIKDKTLFQIQIGYLKLIQELEDLKHSNVSIYLGNKNNVYFPLLSKFATEGNHISIITKHLYENYDLLTKIKEYKIKNTHFYEGNEDGLDPFLSKKQDLFLYFPNSSEFENLRIEPDYSIFFEQNSLDIFIKEELAGLENVIKHLNDKATLVYCVRTLGKKETSLLIEEFLKAHPEFELVKEKQFFPYEEENSILYYAILRKKAND